MTATRPVILLFEDTADNARRLIEFFDKEVARNFHFEVFSASEEVTEESFVDRLTNEIKRYGEIALIVSDMDLSKTEGYKGLTDAVITRVAHNVGIPTAYYSTALATLEGRKQDQAGDGRILLGASNYEEIAHLIAVLANGFTAVKKRIEGILAEKASNRPKDAADFVAELIGRRETHHRIGLYLSGNQRMGAEILSSPKGHGAIRQSMIFGTWIYDSLMRYPGVLLNVIAAASYLNISEEDFSRKEIRSLWNEAVYDGPFSDAKAPLFWRDKFDRMLSNANVDDGLEYVKKQGMAATSCRCSVDASVDAGYYCMITSKPVSHENSVGDISWFPPGADLARIAGPKYEELAPWLGA